MSIDPAEVAAYWSLARVAVTCDACGQQVTSLDAELDPARGVVCLVCFASAPAEPAPVCPVCGGVTGHMIGCPEMDRPR